MTFTIMGTLPGLNEISNASRTNWYMGHKQKREATDLCRFWVNAAKLKPITTPIKVHFEWFEKDLRRDPDNVRCGAKYILDALVEAAILPRDSRKWVKGLSDGYPDPDKQKPRIEVTIHVL